MKASKKKEIKEIQKQLYICKLQLQLFQIEEQEIMETVSEESARYETLEENDSYFDEAIDGLGEALANLEEITGYSPIPEENQ